MYEYCYDYAKPKYGNSLETDSFIVHVIPEDVNANLAKNEKQDWIR